jgi:hypothetical protein
MALDAENSIPIIFVDQIICNSNFYFCLKAQNVGGGEEEENICFGLLGCGGVLRRK